MITKKMLKASRYHNVRCLMRSAMHRPTTYTRKVAVVETVTEVANVMASSARSLLRRLLDFVRRLFGRPTPGYPT